MKANLTFNLDDLSDRLSHKRCVNSLNAYIALCDISNIIFRPARKYGYNDSKIKELLEKLTEDQQQTVYEIIGELEDLYINILNDNNIDLSDLE